MCQRGHEVWIPSNGYIRQFSEYKIKIYKLEKRNKENMGNECGSKEDGERRKVEEEGETNHKNNGKGEQVMTEDDLMTELEQSI